ncbi:hypothetical protein GLOTRDRAFT_119765, partial [Gloeophyllum trabeum ATCC 11539]
MSVSEAGSCNSSKVLLPSIRELFPEQYSAPLPRPGVRANVSPTSATRHRMAAPLHTPVEPRTGCGDRLSRTTYPSADFHYKASTPRDAGDEASVKHRGERHY